MRRLLVPLLAAALLGGGAVARANENCPQAVKDVRGTNPAPATIAGYVATSAARHGVPPQVVKAVAYQESGWRPFRVDGGPTLSNDSVCGIGLMQITLGSRTDGVRLASDVAYNVDEGVKILRKKWDDTVAYNPSEPTGYDTDDPRVLENWYGPICRYNGYQGCGVANSDKHYALPVSKLIRDPFQAGIPSAIVAHMPPAGFTTPYDADPEYVFPGGFQAQADDEFHFFDSTTGALTKVVNAPTHTDAPFPGYGAGTYGPGGPNVSCVGCEWWRPAEGSGTAGWAHWTNSVTGADAVRVTWTPPRAGPYDVAAFVPALGSAPLAPATYHFGTATQTVDQNAVKGTWVGLGRRSLSAAAPMWLGDRSTVPDVQIVADAVRLSAVPALSVTTTAGTVTYGSATTLTARLTHGGAALPGQAVRLYRRSVGATSWTGIGTYATNSAGAVSLAVKPARNTEYTARFTAPDAGFVSAASGNRRVYVRPKVAGSLSRTSVARGTAVTVAASVSPAHAGQTVYLQRLVSGVWQNSASRALSGSSTASFGVSRSAAGTYYYRVYKPADGDHVKAYSATLTLKVT